VYLVRYVVNLTSGRFETDAVFPNISSTLGPQASFNHNGGNPTILRQNGHTFVGFQSGPSIYKFRSTALGGHVHRHGARF
jgi:hypothetical protein